MFKRKFDDPLLERAILRLHDDMHQEKVDSDAYAQMADQLTKLYALKDHTVAKRVSPDVLATIGANIVGILLIVGHERANVLTSKAMSFIKQAR